MHTRTEFVIGNNKLCLMMLRANLVPRVLSPLPPPPASLTFKAPINPSQGNQNHARPHLGWLTWPWHSRVISGTQALLTSHHHTVYCNNHQLNSKE